MNQRARVGEGPGGAWECRPARGADAAGIAEAIAAAWRASYAGLVSGDFLQALDVKRIAEVWRREPASTRAFRQVLVSGGSVVGAASGGPASGAGLPGRAELYSINVHPQHWGRGAGQLLLSAAEGRLREAGFSQATLWVIAGNTRACRFYERAGWVPTGEERTTSDLTGSPLRELCLERELGCDEGAPAGPGARGATGRACC
jgi:ribosomal protein S18 acetylase RimI-like enzyme